MSPNYHPPMRLTPPQIDDAVRHLAGPDATVKLFGSRLDDAARGGGIDLLVECERLVAEPVGLACRITARLQRTLGDRKIDVLVIDPETPLDPVHRAARLHGVALKGSLPPKLLQQQEAARR